jgi:putative chitinase
MKTENLNRSLNPAIMGEVFSIVEKFNITNHLRLAHFLSQCAHESGNFKLLTENLNYSADGLLKIFPKYFKDKATADAYARKPEKIGSRVYANRMGNGDEASGEGYKFRGRGYIQLTGKDNYKQFSDFIGEDVVANPDLVATKYPLTSAAFFFNKNGLWTICDKGDTTDVVTLVTKRVNGGTHGLDDRISKFNTFNTLLA